MIFIVIHSVSLGGVGLMEIILYCLAILGDEIAMCGMHIDWKPFRVQCESNKPINECEAPPTHIYYED